MLVVVVAAAVEFVVVAFDDESVVAYAVAVEIELFHLMVNLVEIEPFDWLSFVVDSLALLVDGLVVDELADLAV